MGRASRRATAAGSGSLSQTRPRRAGQHRRRPACRCTSSRSPPRRRTAGTRPRSGSARSRRRTSRRRAPGSSRRGRSRRGPSRRRRRRARPGTSRRAGRRASGRAGCRGPAILLSRSADPSGPCSRRSGARRPHPCSNQLFRTIPVTRGGAPVPSEAWPGPGLGVQVLIARGALDEALVEEALQARRVERAVALEARPREAVDRDHDGELRLRGAGAGAGGAGDGRKGKGESEGGGRARASRVMGLSCHGAARISACKRAVELPVKIVW